eukprot:3750816-Rhodomonas_salina.1
MPAAHIEGDQQRRKQLQIKHSESMTAKVPAASVEEKSAAGGEEKAETEDDEEAVVHKAGVVDIDYCSYEDGDHCSGNE